MATLMTLSYNYVSELRTSELTAPVLFISTQVVNVHGSIVGIIVLCKTARRFFATYFVFHRRRKKDLEIEGE